MRLFLFMTLYSFSLGSLAGTTDAEINVIHTPITLSSEQIVSYGIKTVPVQTSDEILGARHPAEVVIPSSQLQVVSALQGGLLEAVLVAEGDTVDKNQPLALLKSPGLLELQRDLLQTLIQLNLARSTLNREQKLLDEGIIPKRRYLESRSEWQALVTQKEQQEAMLQFSGMSQEAIKMLEKSRKLDSTLTVISPFKGVILEQMAIAGEKLEATDPILKIGQLSPLWLDIHVPLDVAHTVSIGDTVTVPELDIKGEIITIGKKVHAADQGTLIRAIVRENTDRIRPGQVVQTRITQISDQRRYGVPRKAIVRVDEKTVVFIKTDQGFLPVFVDVVGSQGDQIIIHSHDPIETPVVSRGAVILKSIMIDAGGEG